MTELVMILHDRKSCDSSQHNWLLFVTTELVIILYDRTDYVFLKTEIVVILHERTKSDSSR